MLPIVIPIALGIAYYLYGPKESVKKVDKPAKVVKKVVKPEKKDGKNEQLLEVNINGDGDNGSGLPSPSTPKCSGGLNPDEVNTNEGRTGNVHDVVSESESDGQNVGEGVSNEPGN